MKVGRIGNTCTQHGSTGQQLECTQKICFTHSQDIQGIYQVYTTYIPCLFQSLDSPGLLCGPHSFGSIGPGLPSDLLSLGHWEAAHARLGPSKIPQPGVDLVNLAAPPRGRARTIGTAALKSVPLSAAVLMWNSWGCISVQKARNSAKEVLNPSEVERGNRLGLIHPVNSFRFHDSSCPQAKFLKGAEENQVERNILVGTVEAARRSTYGTQCTVEEQLGTHKPHNVWIEKWFCNVIIVVTLSNVEWIRRDSCQTILQWAQSGQYMYFPRIWPAYIRNIQYIYHVYVFTLGGRYVPISSTVPACTALYRYVPFTPSMYQYVLFTPSTDSVITSQNSKYSVRTEYRIHDKSTYLRLKVQTFQVRAAYQYVPVRTEYILLCYSCTYFSSFLKGTYTGSVHTNFGGVLALGSKFLILWRSSQAAQPVCLPLIQAQATHCQWSQTTLKHWQFYSLLLGSTLVSGRAPCLGATCAGCLLRDWAAAGQLHPSCLYHDELSAHQQPQPQLATQCALQMGVTVWRTWASSCSVNDELQNFQAILLNSSSEILWER